MATTIHRGPLKFKVCTYVCMFVRMYSCYNTRMYAFMYVCAYVCMFVLGPIIVQAVIPRFLGLGVRYCLG